MSVDDTPTSFFVSFRLSFLSTSESTKSGSFVLKCFLTLTKCWKNNVAWYNDRHMACHVVKNLKREIGGENALFG